MGLCFDRYFLILFLAFKLLHVLTNEFSEQDVTVMHLLTAVCVFWQPDTANTAAVLPQLSITNKLKK